jgi:hypothetical protein
MELLRAGETPQGCPFAQQRLRLCAAVHCHAANQRVETMTETAFNARMNSAIRALRTNQRNNAQNSRSTT